ncbi:hypothetical protein TOT_020000737 [Theileria orientalis strain Shintoku]|uniref:Uncharacterized protein n=1 Tax=Theileria orientalis strain Shintoku TaxID=869250 RepID=J4C3I1_THEOR|nr:hypothetical protein TOT_020000737 [Theileria orientalis strain Shintoku]PVC51247.1 hypothetical protein MACL_00001680 [Theileria orientalis]BAM40481.1 hypothetical protein TOT_020000737 [Theileria orientalis strain Shintoku]|eukprot:XP_009690782.1 hypothetical protein TOT_020000737 [Theileria orientalis strain Shintoku]
MVEGTRNIYTIKMLKKEIPGYLLYQYRNNDLKMNIV